VVDPETLPTFCVPVVPVASVQRITTINQVQQGGQSSIVAGDILSGFSESPLPFLSGEQSLKELLTVITGGTVSMQNGLKQISQAPRVLRKRRILSFPVVQVTT
jgi:hypothetical protein